MFQAQIGSLLRTDILSFLKWWRNIHICKFFWTLHLIITWWLLSLQVFPPYQQCVTSYLNIAHNFPRSVISYLTLLFFSSSLQQEEKPARRSTTSWPPAPRQSASGSPPPTRRCPSRRWWTSTSPQGCPGQVGRPGSRGRQSTTTPPSESGRRTPCRPRRAPARATSVRRRRKVCGGVSRSRDSSHRVDTLFTSYPPPITCCVSTPCACAGRCQSVRVCDFRFQASSTCL